MYGGSVSRRERLSFDYDAVEIRVSSLDELDSDANGQYETRTRTESLVDPHNFTGYEQKANLVKPLLYMSIGGVKLASVRAKSTSDVEA